MQSVLERRGRAVKREARDLHYADWGSRPCADASNKNLGLS